MVDHYRSFGGASPAIKQLSGSAMLGNFLLLLFLASNGANSVITRIIEVEPGVFYLAVGTIGIHGVIILCISLSAQSFAIATIVHFLLCYLAVNILIKSIPGRGLNLVELFSRKYFLIQFQIIVDHYLGGKLL